MHTFTDTRIHTLIYTHNPDTGAHTAHIHRHTHITQTHMKMKALVDFLPKSKIFLLFVFLIVDFFILRKIFKMKSYHLKLYITIDDFKNNVLLQIFQSG